MSSWFSRVEQEHEAGNLTATQYLVLCELGRRLEGGELRIRQEELAAHARCTVRTVQHTLQAARRLGLVEWTSVGKFNRYHLGVSR